MKFSEIIKEIESMTWEEVKEGGSNHYKNSPDKPELIDIYRANGSLRQFALNNIMKYANRNVSYKDPVKLKDMTKIVHYACMLFVQQKELNEGLQFESKEEESEFNKYVRETVLRYIEESKEKKDAC